jgi:hypothetical protein
MLEPAPKVSVAGLIAMDTRVGSTIVKVVAGDVTVPEFVVTEAVSWQVPAALA